MAPKKKKQRKEAQKKLQNMNFDQLVEKGKENLEAGKPRDAISFFKVAGKRGSFSDEINAFLFRSYLMRESQLRDKGMLVEADTVRKQAREYMPEFKKVSEGDMEAYISTCPNKEAFDAYAEYIQANDRSAKTERLLANRLFTSGKWELLNKLDESLPLRCDAIPAQKAVLLMNSGNWEEALEALKPIGRSSCFAHVRMFCRAMVSFYREDDKDMLRALSMIPDDFPLKPVMESLKQIRVDKDEDMEKTGAIPMLSCLWDGPVNKEKYVADLLYELEQKKFDQAKASICRLAEAVYPQDPTAARSHILQIIWNMANQEMISDYQFQTMVRDLLPKEHAAILLAKTRLLNFTDPFSAVGKYLSVLENDFSDSKQRDMARSIILEYAVENVYEKRTNLKRYSHGMGFQRYKKLMGITSDDNEIMLIDMALESIRLDPYNKKGYELLAALPRLSRPAKNKVETILSSMAEYFPDDPYPCLELASLYYEKNAFRKAENILAEAMKRAPHDNRVIDRHALSLLISGDKNIKRGNPHLVIRDIEKAEKIGSKKVAPFIIEKLILFQLLTHKKDAKKLIEDELRDLSPTRQLRILAFLILDIKTRDMDSKKKSLKTIEKIFNNRLKKAKEFSSSDIMKLLMPLEKEYLSILPSREIAPVFFKNSTNILKNFNDSEIIPLFDLIFAPDSFNVIKKEIQRRIKKATSNQRLVLNFYLVAIRHITGEIIDFDLFNDLIDQTEGPVKEELRTISRRLSKHAAGPLKDALERFDFDMFGGGYFDDDLFDDDYEDYDDDIFPVESLGEGLETFFEMLDILRSDPDLMDTGVEEGILEKWVEGLESFVDGSGFRGAPDYVIKSIRQLIRSNPESRLELDMLSKLIDPKKFPQLSHEARIFLYGKKKR